MFVTWDNENGDGTDGESGVDAAAAAAEATAAAASTNESGKTKPSDAEAALLKEVMEKKEAAKKALATANAAKAEAEELRGKLAAFDGVDLEQVREMLRERADRETAELEKKGEWNRLKAQMVEQHTKEIEALRGETTGKVTELSESLTKREREIHELTIGRSFSESPFIRESLTLTPSKARVIYGAHFELKDGKVTGYDLPVGSENRTPLVDGNGEPLSFDKAIEKIVELDPDRDNLLKSKMRNGANSDNDPSAKKQDKKAELRGMDRIKAALATGVLPLPKNQ